MYLPSILEESLPLSHYQSLYSFIQVRYLNGHCDAIGFDRLAVEKKKWKYYVQKDRIIVGGMMNIRGKVECCY